MNPPGGSDEAKLAAIRKAVVDDFLGMYGSSSLPAFAAAKELAWEVRAILAGAGTEAELEHAARDESARLKAELTEAQAQIRRLNDAGLVAGAAERVANHLCGEIAAEREMTAAIKGLCLEVAGSRWRFRPRRGGEARMAARVLKIISDRRRA